MTVLEIAIIVIVISGGTTALFVKRHQSSPVPLETSATSSPVTQPEISKPDPVQQDASSSAPAVAATHSPSSVQTPKRVDCSAEYYKNTKVYQDMWAYHQQTVKGYIDQINSSTVLDADQKEEQINIWAKYFNDRVNELVAIWKKSMTDSGCGSTPMGFSPGYMPVSE